MAVLRLVDGKLEVNEEEAEAIRVIFQQYATTEPVRTALQSIWKTMAFIAYDKYSQSFVSICNRVFLI